MKIVLDNYREIRESVRTMKHYQWRDAFVRASTRSDAKSKLATTFGKGIPLAEIQLTRGSEMRRKCREWLR